MVQKPRFAMLTLMFLLLMCIVPIAQAATVLFDNGSFSGPQINLRNTTGNGGAQRIFDDFILSDAVEITGFEWLQHDRDDMEYISTEVRIYDGLPLATNLVFTVNVVAVRTPNVTGTFFDRWEGFDYAITGLSIRLPPGTYFLGLNTNSSIGDSSWDQTSGNGSNLPGRYVQNFNFPEPGKFIADQDSVFKVIGYRVTGPYPSIEGTSVPMLSLFGLVVLASLVLGIGLATRRHHS